MQNLINNLRDHLKYNVGLSGSVLENILRQSLVSIERLSFGRILSEELTEDEVDIYKELLDIDGEVDGYGFLKGVRPTEADSLIQRFMTEEVNNFIRNC
jgi:hypothetical protein